MTGLLVMAIAACIVAAVALAWPRHHCSVCGKCCDGRIAGGTIDNPLCVECVSGRSTLVTDPGSAAARGVGCVCDPQTPRLVDGRRVFRVEPFCPVHGLAEIKAELNR